MKKFIAAALIASAGLTATNALAENPGQHQERKIAAALAKAEKAPAQTTNPVTAVFSFGSDAIDTLTKTKSAPHSGKDRYAPPRGAFGGPDR